jgi:hypothetical protein
MAMWLLKFSKLVFDSVSIVISTFIQFESVGVVTLALGSRQRQGLARVRAKREAQESHAPRSVGVCEGMNPHIPK